MWGASHMGGVLLWITNLEGDSFCMDDSLEIGVPYGNEGSPHLQFCPYSCLETKIFGMGGR